MSEHLTNLLGIISYALRWRLSRLHVHLSWKVGVYTCHKVLNLRTSAILSPALAQVTLVTMEVPSVNTLGAMSQQAKCQTLCYIGQPSELAFVVQLGPDSDSIISCSMAMPAYAVIWTVQVSCVADLLFGCFV